MVLRKLAVSAATALALCLGDGFGQAAHAQTQPTINPVDFNTGIQIISQTSNSAILEGADASMSFTIRNNTNNFVILDLAELVIGDALPDADDVPYNPFNVSFAPFIAPQGTAVYTYGAESGPLDFGDFGIAPITLQIYMSEISGNPITLPPVINTLLPCPAPAQQVGCTILTFYEPLLNPPFVVGPQHEADNFAAPLPFQVNDLPEPSTLSFVGLGGLAFLGFRKRGNRAA